MLETIKLVLTQFNEEALAISGLIFVLVFGTLIILWIYNKKRYNQLLHQIPATVVKNYLDSIIQNSNALKSSLFRGGGLDIGDGIPSVLPVAKLSGGQVEVSSELLNQKNAELAALHGKLSERERTIKDLEAKLREMQGSSDKGPLMSEVSNLQGMLKNAEKKLADDVGQIQVLKKEKEDLQGRLMEYEIIEDDLANLKKLQIENEELRKKLGMSGKAGLDGGSKKGAPAAPEPAGDDPFAEEEKILKASESSTSPGEEVHETGGDQDHDSSVEDSVMAELSAQDEGAGGGGEPEVSSEHSSEGMNGHPEDNEMGMPEGMDGRSDEHGMPSMPEMPEMGGAPMAPEEAVSRSAPEKAKNKKNDAETKDKDKGGPPAAGPQIGEGDGKSAEDLLSEFEKMLE